MPIGSWDDSARSHGYLRNADVAFKGNTIIHVGKSYGEKADRVIDGRDLMIMPGLVDIRSHPSLEPSWRGIREEHGVPEMYMTGLYERAVAREECVTSLDLDELVAVLWKFISHLIIPLTEAPQRRRRLSSGSIFRLD